MTKTLKMKPPTIANWITAKSDDLETLPQCANDPYDGMAGNDSSHVKEAVYVGVVGARFEKKGCMEYQDILLEGMFITSVLT